MSVLAVIQSVSGDQAHILTEAIALGVVVGTGRIWDHLKGRRRDAYALRLERKLDEYQASNQRLLAAHHDRITKVEHTVFGVDGENGHRAKLRELADVADELKRRGYLDTPPDFPSTKPARYEL